MLGKAYEWVLGIPWVYDRVRPFVVGTLDYSEVYDWLESTEDDVVLDVGCGTGASFEHLRTFREYHGFDTEPRALATLERRYGGPKVWVYNRLLEKEDVQRIRPTRVIAMGLLHHIADHDVTELLHTVAASGSVQRMVTIDTVYLPGRPLNNVLAALDRGRHVRNPARYQELVEASAFRVVKTTLCDAGRQLSSYFGMCLEPRSASTAVAK